MPLFKNLKLQEKAKRNKLLYMRQMREIEYSMADKWARAAAQWSVILATIGLLIYAKLVF